MIDEGPEEEKENEKTDGRQEVKRTRSLTKAKKRKRRTVKKDPKFKNSE
jgi:hypothetical protein